MSYKIARGRVPPDRPEAAAKPISGSQKTAPSPDQTASNTHPGDAQKPPSSTASARR